MTIMSKISSPGLSTTYKKTATILVNSFSPYVDGDNNVNIVSSRNSSNLNIETGTLPPYFYPTPLLSPVLPTTITNLENSGNSDNIVMKENYQIHLDNNEHEEFNDNDSVLKELSIWLISTLKRRKKKMNKHKLRKRRKLLRLKSKK